MSTPVILQEFSESNPYSPEKLNENFRAIAAIANTLAGDTLLQVGAAGASLTGYVPVSGGAFLGQISAPSILIGPNDGTKHNAVTTNDFAQSTQGGVVKLAANVAALATAISNPPTQAEVTEIKNKVNELLTALVNAQQMASGA